MLSKIPPSFFIATIPVVVTAMFPSNPFVESPTVLHAQGCTVEMRSFDELNSIVASPFPGGSMAEIQEVAEILQFRSRVFVVPSGTPVSDSEYEEVTRVIVDYYSCIAVGNDLAALQYLTDDWIRAQVAVAGVVEPSQATPAAMNVAPRLEPDTALNILNIQVVGDGRLGAAVGFKLPDGRVRADFVLLVPVADGYLISGVREGIENVE